MYGKRGIRVNVWAEIQLNVFKFFASNIHALEQGRLRSMFYSYFLTDSKVAESTMSPRKSLNCSKKCFPIS